MAQSTPYPTSNHHTAQEEAWWQRYLAFLGQHGVADKALPYYRWRVEGLLRRFPGVASTALTGEQVTAHLTAIDGRGKPWQLQQELDALHRFGLYCRVGWVEAVDWAWWQARWSDTTAGGDQTSLAERVKAIEQGVLPEDAGLRQFAVRMRTRQMSLRTEQTCWSGGYCPAAKGGWHVVP